MPSTPDDLFAYLASLNIPQQTSWHQAVFTVEEGRALRGEAEGGHTKNLFVRDKKGTPFLVVAQEDTAVELKSLHRRLGASGRFSFGSRELMQELLGVEPGSVTPFSVINDTGHRVTVVLDSRLMAHDILHFHPLTNTGTTTIARADLVKFLTATGHPPRIETLTGDGAGEGS
jgi:Ala-tRNA(Pro) deacylase